MNELTTDNIIIYLSVSHLDDRTKEKWAEHCQDRVNKTTAITSDYLIDFISARSNILSSKGSCSADPNKSQPAKQSYTPYRKSVNNNQAHFSGTSITCSICKDKHRIYTCPRFANSSYQRRWELVKEAKLCSNCLGKGHNHDNCSSSGRCMSCKGKHHTYLHLENKGTKIQQDKTSVTETAPGTASNSAQLISPPVPTSSNTQAQSTRTGLVTNVPSKGFVFMPTAIFDIRDNRGAFHSCRALIDSASDVNIMTDALAKKLCLNRQPQCIQLEGIGSLRTTVSTEVTTMIRSQCQDYSRELDFVVLPGITSAKPAVNVSSKHFQIPANIKLADPNFNQSSAVDVLLSAEIVHELLESGIIQLNKAGVSAVNTKLGWTVSGKCAVISDAYNYNVLHVSNEELDNQLKRFWEVETVPHKPEIRESASEKHFKSTTCRDVDGRFIVKLPFNDEVHNLGSTHTLAYKHFLYLERRFLRNPSLRENYALNLQDYLNRGHMTVCDNDNQSDGYYMPHHAVFKHTSITTKCRVVFNASAKSTTGISLNDTLHVGPVIQDNLHNILIRFRKHAIVLTSDIEQMYRQVLMTPEHRKYQKILWRSSPEDDIKTYTLNTVSFGVASSPFSATRCLNELANLVSKDLPNVAQIIRNDFYVDDCLTGCNTISEAFALKRDLITVLGSGRFNLTKWRSNIRELSEESADAMLNLSDAHMNTLGLMWNYQSDTLHFRINLDNLVSGRVTKRTITSNACKLFDPLGLLAPIIVTAKVLVQDLWKLKLDWDEPVPNDIELKWNVYRNSLHELDLITIPRCVISDSNTNQFELHGFCDASLKAYGAVLYIRTLNSNNTINISLLCSKTRVAPTKVISVPRLELSGAVLLAELIKTTIDSINISFKQVFLWTDSTIVLQWINKQSSEFNTFVGNRVGRIQDLTARYIWRHIRTNENPADLSSRGVPPGDLIRNSIWWNGPSFLLQNESHWPSTEFPLIDQLPEQRPRLATTLIVNEPLQLSTRY